MEKVKIESELTGSVWKIVAKVGEKVSEGDELIILESMKMEIPIIAPEDGIIIEIKVKEGSIIQTGDVAIVMET
ncbi:biotin/lipoyl-binding carrier protein [Sporosarcina sp. CAU 1771]